jgi:FkbM family methyltransferase
VYDFESDVAAPRILDCGSNIGVSALFFKHRYPRARITCFEPDPAVAPYLEENLARNGFADVDIRRVAVAGREGTLVFYSDGRCASTLAEFAPAVIPPDWQRFEVPCIRLRDCLSEPIDFLKINIEGAETEAVADAADELRAVRELAIEYHHLPGLGRSLHTLLGVLDAAGFDYVVHSFDAETSAGAQPPFQLDEQSSYFLLVYARRRASGRS